MSWKQTFSIILISYSLSLSATTFLPTPLKDRLSSSSGVVRGQYLGMAYKKLPTGRVVTEVTVKVSEVSGIEPHRLVNPKIFKVLYPGGNWNGMTHKVQGSPVFNKDEEVIIIVKKSDFGYILPNLGMSKFSLKGTAGKKELVSSIFSEKDGVGKISLKNFNLLAQDVYGQSLKKIDSDKFIFNPNKLEERPYRSNRSSKRSPASRAEKKSEDDNEIPLWWFIFGFGFLGFVPHLLFKEKSE